MPPRAVVLAAGRGRRLGGFGDQRPKCLLSFGGCTLLERQVRMLEAFGIAELSVVVGYRARQIADELTRLLKPEIELVVNPDFQRGSLLSLAMAARSLRAGGDVLVMDADVLCSPSVLAPLITHAGSALLLDRSCSLDDPEPVKVAVRNGRMVSFAKRLDPRLSWDYVGESVGFFRLTESAALHLAEESEHRLRHGGWDEPYENAMSAVLLHEAEHCRLHDVSGLPWIEIDFPEDLERAQRDIVPRLAEVDPPLLHSASWRGSTA